MAAGATGQHKHDNSKQHSMKDPSANNKIAQYSIVLHLLIGSFPQDFKDSEVY